MNLTLKPIHWIAIGLIALLVVLSIASKECSPAALGKRETFIVDWGLTASPYRCRGGRMPDDITPPTHTAVCDIWSDPEHIIDERVQRVLDGTYGTVREVEDFLYVNVPNERAQTKD